MRLSEIGKLIGILCGIIAIVLLIMWLAGLFEFLEKHSGTFLVIFTGVVAFSTVLYALLTSNLLSGTKRMREDQIRSLIIAFLAELIYNFNRCVLYYGQFHIGGRATKSSLYELTDAGTLSSLATVVDNPKVISTIVELKAHYYQIKRHSDVIASQIAERDQLTSQIVQLQKKISRPGGDVIRAIAKELEILSSKKDSLEKAIPASQGSALSFFDYEQVVSDTNLILSEAKRLMPKQELVVKMEKQFRNDCSAKEFVDKEIERKPESEAELKQWHENAWDKFENLIK